MSDSTECGDKASLAAYLYEECGAAERQQVEAHLAVCAACAQELQALQAVRGTLDAWAPPEPALGFKIVAADAVAPSWWGRWTGAPAWALAAAAVLVLAVAAAVSNLEVRYGPEGLVVRTGWASSDGRAEPQRADTSPPPWRSDLVALEQQLRREFATPPRRAERPTLAAPVAPIVPSRDAILRQVRSLIDESETRQDRELALRVNQLVRDFELQRQTDLLQIEQGFGQLEGLTDYLVRVSQR